MSEIFFAIEIGEFFAFHMGSRVFIDGFLMKEYKRIGNNCIIRLIIARFIGNK